MAHPEDAEDAVPMIEIVKRGNNSMPMMRDIIVGAAPDLGDQNYIKFDWFTAMDPRLGDPKERVKIFKVLGIQYQNPDKEEGQISKDWSTTSSTKEGSR